MAPAGRVERGGGWGGAFLISNAWSCDHCCVEGGGEDITVNKHIMNPAGHERVFLILIRFTVFVPARA